MDSLLNPKEYQMLGNIEVRADDWARLRKLGFFRFVLNCVSCSFGGRVGAGVLFLVIASYLEKHSLDASSCFYVFLGLVSIGASIKYSAGSWFRLEARFAPQVDPILLSK